MDAIAVANRLFLRELTSLVHEVEAFPSDAMVWKTAPGITNSVGILAQHSCGNLQYYIGAVLGQTGYVRDRDAEFLVHDHTRAELAASLRETAAVVARTLGGKSVADLPEVYPVEFGGVQIPTTLFLAHLESHLAFHLGQAGYLRRILTGSEKGTGAVSLAALADAAAK